MSPLTQKITWLSSIRILLLGHYVPAPLACYLLHNLGAEVIKVEDGAGDHLRHMGSFQALPHAKMGPMFWTINAGFKSLGLQYRKPESADILRQLLAQVDVVIDGHRAGALERYLGAPLADLAPHIIHVPITAYGLVGPMSKLAGHDNNILALAGNLSYTQTDSEGRPTVFSAPVADIMAAQLATIGTLAALIGRQKLPPDAMQAQTIDASMLHAGFFLNLLELSMRNDPTAEVPKPAAAWMNGGRADYRPYRCSDGHFIFFGLIEQWACKRFFMEMGREDLAAYLTDAQLLAPALEEFFLTHTQTEWVAIGARHDACITPVNDLESAIAHPQIEALGRIQTVEHDELGTIQVPSFPLGFGSASTPLPATASAPSLGQHNEEVLGGLLGFTQTQIDDLYDKELIVKANA